MTGRAKWEDMTAAPKKMSSFERSKRDIADNVEAAKKAKPAVPEKKEPETFKGGILRVDMGLKKAGVY